MKKNSNLDRLIENAQNRASLYSDRIGLMIKIADLEVQKIMAFQCKIDQYANQYKEMTKSFNDRAIGIYPEWELVKSSHMESVLLGATGCSQKKSVSDDFIHFCQTGKYPDKVEPDIDDEVKPENQYIYDVKQRLRKALQGNHLNVYSLLELAVEIAPDTSFAEDAFSEVLDAFKSNPERVINNLPR